MIEEQQNLNIESVNDIKSVTDSEIDELLLTKKELKKIRKAERQEKKNKSLQDSDEIIENPHLTRIKKKLDTIPEIRSQELVQPPKMTQNTQETSNPQQSITTLSNSNVPDLVKPKQSHEAGRVIQNQVGNPPMDDSGDVDLNKLFSSEVGSESDVVKELFTQENIKVKTELTQDEVSIISRLELQASMTQNFFLSKVLKELEVLRVSKDRKSRTEFVQSFSGIKDANSGATAFGKLSGIFKNDKV